MNTKISNPAKAVISLLVGATLFIGSLAFVDSVMDVEPETIVLGKEAQFFDIQEFVTIRIAAIRNGIQPGTENWRILLAIRKAENGKPGLEFGIMNPKANDLDSQAGWAAASILGARGRWDGKGDFVDAMGARYCPPADHPLNKHWAGNVRHWVEKLGGAK